MKNIKTIAVILLVIVFARCDKDNNNQVNKLILGDTVELSINETIHNYDKNISIRMDSVLNDSRCPSSVICVWEGNAEVRFIFTHNNDETSFSLNTNVGNNFKTDSIVNGYRIEMINLYPYPENPGIIPQKDYQADILILKE